MSKFFAYIYEELSGLYFDPYSNVLYDGNGYTTLGLSILISSFSIMFLFYYVWNPVLGRWYHWVLMIVLTFLINLGIGYGVVAQELVSYLDDPNYSDTENYLWMIASLTGLYASLCSVIWSFGIRFWSSNNKTNPIAF